MLVHYNEHSTQQKCLIFRPQKPPFRCKVPPLLYIHFTSRDPEMMVCSDASVEARLRLTLSRHPRFSLAKATVGVLAVEAQNAKSGRASTRTKRGIPRLILPAGLVELPGDPLVDVPVLGDRGGVHPPRLDPTHRTARYSEVFRALPSCRIHVHCPDEFARRMFPSSVARNPRSASS